jgi:hypothetical protein
VSDLFTLPSVVAPSLLPEKLKAIQEFYFNNRIFEKSTGDRFRFILQSLKKQWNTQFICLTALKFVYRPCGTKPFTKSSIRHGVCFYFYRGVLLEIIREEFEPRLWKDNFTLRILTRYPNPEIAAWLHHCGSPSVTNSRVLLKFQRLSNRQNPHSRRYEGILAVLNEINRDKFVEPPC